MPKYLAPKKVQPLTDKRPSLLAKLRGGMTELDALQAKRYALSAKMFMWAYEWVHITTLLGKHKTIDQASERLANSLRITHAKARDWASCGAFMTANAIPITSHPGAIRALNQRAGKVSKANFLRALQDIIDGHSLSEIKSHLQLAPAAAVSAAERKAAMLEAHGQLNKTQIKMEMLAVQTLAERLYDAHIIVALYNADTGKKIIEAK